MCAADAQETARMAVDTTPKMRNEQDVMEISEQTIFH